MVSVVIQNLANCGGKGNYGESVHSFFIEEKRCSYYRNSVNFVSLPSPLFWRPVSWNFCGIINSFFVQIRTPACGWNDVQNVVVCETENVVVVRETANSVCKRKADKLGKNMEPFLKFYHEDNSGAGTLFSLDLSSGIIGRFSDLISGQKSTAGVF